MRGAIDVLISLEFRWCRSTIIVIFLLDVPEAQKGVAGHGWWHLEGKHPFLTSDQSIFDYLRL
jgi:uncharacterized membrane protein